MRNPRRQATRAVEAVRRGHRRSRVRRYGTRPASTVASPRTIDRALRVVDGLPPVRVELVVAAAERLAAGDRPSSAAIAERAIERAVGDRLV